MRTGGLWPKGLVWLLGAVAMVPLGSLTAVPLLGQTDETGNGAPSGAHYNLNIIGVPKVKDAPMDDNNGHRIFVGLGSKKDNVTVTSRIYLAQSTDGSFKVLDANGTDGRAEFQLPAPGGYTIWARPLGKPNGEARITTCGEYTDPETGMVVEECSLNSELFVREKGMRKFANVTTVLTTIDLVAGSDIALACEATTVTLFDPCLEEYLWKYDNTGLKLLQLRFYYNPEQ